VLNWKLCQKLWGKNKVNCCVGLAGAIIAATCETENAELKTLNIKHYVYDKGFNTNLSNSHFENADQVFKYVILRRPTFKFIVPYSTTGRRRISRFQKLGLFFSVLVQN
jgi:hypothetical protein